MSVELEPAELGFRRPLTREVSESLYIRNPHDRPIIFKVKTTAPRRYCVRPNSGRVEPGRHMEVQVLLQSMKEDPPLDAKCKDKFLVLSVVVTADKDFSNIASIWQEVEKTSKSSIQERKLRVNFLPSNDATGMTSGEGSTQAPPSYDEESTLNTSPSAQYDTPANNRTVMMDSSPQDPQELEAKGSDSPSQRGTQEAPNPTATEAGAQGSRDSSKFTEDLLGQLTEAKSQIRKLQQQATDNELRQRKAQGDGAKSGSGLKQQQSTPPQATETGVSLQIVAALCLLSFLLAYFFF